MTPYSVDPLARLAVTLESLDPKELIYALAARGRAALAHETDPEKRAAVGVLEDAAAILRAGGKVPMTAADPDALPRAILTIACPRR